MTVVVTPWSANAKVEWRTYSNGRPALVLEDAETKEPLGRVSVNLPDEHMDDDEIALDHDFASVLEPILVKAGVLAPHHRVTKRKSTWVRFRVCRILEKDSD